MTDELSFLRKAAVRAGIAALAVAWFLVATTRLAFAGPGPSPDHGSVNRARVGNAIGPSSTLLTVINSEACKAGQLPASMSSVGYRAP